MGPRMNFRKWLNYLLKNPQSSVLALDIPKIELKLEPKQAPHLPTYLDEEDQVRRLLAIALSRQASQFIGHVTTARVKLTASQLKDGMKGKIVGKDGRNARHFEERAGVDLLLNDEPNSVMISCFDSFRREVARVALESLVRDGRIQPSRIEEVVADVDTQTSEIVLIVHWKGGVHTELRVPRRRAGQRRSLWCPARPT